MRTGERRVGAGTMIDERTAAKSATAPGKMTLVESLISRGGTSQAGSDPAGPPASVEIEAGVVVDFLIERGELDNDDGTQDGESDDGGAERGDALWPLSELWN
jgi:hypothetical protein